MEVAEYVKYIGQRNTSRLFDISQRRIFDWVSQNNQVEKDDTTRKSEETESFQTRSRIESLDPMLNTETTETRSGSDPVTRKQFVAKSSNKNSTNGLKINKDIERDVFEWVKDQLPVKVSSTHIRDKARELYR